MLQNQTIAIIGNALEFYTLVINESNLLKADLFCYMYKILVSVKFSVFENKDYAKRVQKRGIIPYLDQGKW